MSRRIATLVLAAASVAALAGCDGVVGATMTFNDTEKTKVTDIVLDGGSGDVLVTTGNVTETKIKRVVRGGNGSSTTYQLSGTTLTLPTSCGIDCRISYEVQAPTGVKVRGKVSSGDVTLSDVGAVDITLTSGDVRVDGSATPVKIKATSGDVDIVRAPGVTVEATSGNIAAREITGPVTARVSSGELDLQLATAASVTAEVASGDLMLLVPAGSYRINQHVNGSGDAAIHGITNDPKSPNVLDLRARSGDLTVNAL
ncbi:DUF4097 and DUF4098 domain-containing protein YvlB [Actinoplanes octamycinicus]|uniref:DUF4097 and DUF4098 domain-containing protein YvlB n=1 Tax=Actinoplanes octamycinicus TaxID=135948 RepID=A0A7W7GWK0_9ACTN|nr:DUF4097 family beta strand repeat-containing protein [Actinoplanes octamycinicus]MBB4739477.1 DUF4097 and DUF4098 domain-containing protein YvlB [Actinoplanes octamycinicus]GIE54660.1 hypothetical protein Aoc01nite_00620 [Actinoplanes octamycinicus]